jgi:hypothetical protein
VQRHGCNGGGMNFSQNKDKFWYNIKQKYRISRYLQNDLNWSMAMEQFQ